MQFVSYPSLACGGTNFLYAAGGFCICYWALRVNFAYTIHDVMGNCTMNCIEALTSLTSLVIEDEAPQDFIQRRVHYPATMPVDDRTPQSLSFNSKYVELVPFFFWYK
jgi:hypothetical protein